jgi:hypothetical protein
MRISPSQWAAALAWTAVAAGAAALLAVLGVRGGLRCPAVYSPCVWAGPAVWARAAAAAAAALLAGRAFVPFIRGFLRYLGCAPGRVPAALGACVAALPAAALAPLYARHRPSRWAADLALHPYYVVGVPPARLGLAGAPDAVVEARVRGPFGLTVVRAGGSGRDVQHYAPLRVGDRVAVTFRLLAPGGAVLAASRAYPITVAPDYRYEARVRVSPPGWSEQETGSCWTPETPRPVRPVAAGEPAVALYVLVTGAPEDAVVC